MRTSSARRISLSVLGSLLARWSKKYLSARSPSWLGITVYNDYVHSENEFVFAWKIEIAKCFERMISVLDIKWE